MKPAILFFALILSTSSLFAQTKKIAHRSHSGSDKTFITKGNSNFGITPEMKREQEKQKQLEKAKKDSIARADSLAKAKPAPKSKKAKTKKP